MTTSRIHWIGAGLSSGPGIRRLAKNGYPITLWNRTIQKAYDVFSGDVPGNVTVSAYTYEDLETALQSGEIVVSMLPANFHPQLAKLCLEKKANLVTTSYVSPEMQEFDAAAKEAELAFVNEAGLDPGLDHLLARELFWQYQESPNFDPEAKLSFSSYCGGFPENPGEFCYKFSWSPVGVLRALKSPVQYQKNGDVIQNAKPWKELDQFSYFGEGFEVYPNRDSLPYIEEYGFENFAINNFMRGTLRPSGWSQAWDSLFTDLETANNDWLEKTSQDLWEKYAYSENEKDRVVLYVGLKAEKDGQMIWEDSLSIDELGQDNESAMARLVSLTASFAVESVLENKAPYGVSAATTDKAETKAWLQKLSAEGSVVLNDSKRSVY